MLLAMVEHGPDGATDESLQAVTMARELAGETGGSLAAVAFADPEAGGVPDAATDDIAAHGVADLYVVSHDGLDAYAPEAWASSVGSVVDDLDPTAVVAPGTDRGHEVLAHVVAERELPMAANCLTVDPSGEGGEGGDGSDGAWTLTRQRWGGSLIEHASLDADTKVLTTAPHEVDAAPADETAELTVHDVTPDLGDDAFVVRVERREASDIEGVPLGEARVVVGGGRGVGNADDFAILEELADELGAAVGSSRAAVNEGWRPHDDQIGQTGSKITPKLYIACGISGAVQHMVGCKGAENILAINTDPEAAIIQKGEYAVIGDLHEVVPALTEAIRARKG